MKTFLHKYGLFISITSIFLVSLYGLQWYSNQVCFLKIGQYTKEFLDTSDVKRTVISGNHFKISEQELEYEIAVKQFQKEIKPEQAAFVHIIEWHVALVQGERQKITISNEELEKKKKENPLSYWNITNEEAIDQFFQAWKSKEEGLKAIEPILIEELTIEKYWNIQKQEYEKEHLVLTESQLEEAWKKEKALRLKQFVEREEITNKSFLICEKYNLTYG